MSVKQLAQFFLPTLLLAGLLQGCGSGAVSSPPSTTTGELLVLPAQAEVFPNTPTTFTISGGRAGYAVFSSNNAVVPVTETVNGAQFTIIASEVAQDTTVTLTVRDQNNTTKSATAVVKVSTLSSAVTFTPVSPSATTNCGTGAVMCGGGDAVLQVRSVQNGVPLANRALRFDVVNGQFAFVTSPNGATASTHTVSTDASGTANVTLRAGAGVTSQAAVLRYTDVPTGQAKTFPFAITQFINGASTLTVIPSSAGWTGTNTTNCAANVSTTHYIFGGTPPYTVSNTSPLFAQISPTIVAASGGGVNVTVTGSVCSTGTGGTQFAVTDAAGLTTTFSVSNTVGTAAPPGPPISAPILVPPSVTLACGQSTQIAVVLTGTLSYAVSHPGLITVPPPAGNVLTVTRSSPSTSAVGAAGLAAVTLNVSDGTRVTTGTITLNPPGACP
ncbi:MAG: hypothetical protein SF172_07855 [Burkholderiales bacterium]|nr:hypothetical protein [Burkholderiales bacterium]